MCAGSEFQVLIARYRKKESKKNPKIDFNIFYLQICFNGLTFVYRQYAHNRLPILKISYINETI